MNVGALAKLITKKVAKEGVFTPFGSKDDIQNYVLSEVRRGALPKKRQEYFDTFDPNVYYHSTLENIEKFDPRIDLELGAYGAELGSPVFNPSGESRGATYFTSDRQLADQVLLDKNTLERAKGTNIPNLVVTEDGFSRHYLAGSRIYPVKIKTDKLFDFEDDFDFDKLEDRILSKYSDESDEYKLLGRVQSGDWGVLERPEIQKELKELGFRGYRTDEPGTVGLFYPDEGDVRSLFAKFDPKDEKKGEILATIVPYASVGTIGALAGLEEGT